MVSYSIKVDEGETSFNYYTALDFLNELRAYMGHTRLIVGFNLKFDLHWARRYGILPPNRVRIWDCQIAEFIINGQKGSYPSLDGCLEKYGLGKKQDKVAEFWALGLNTTDVPIEILEEYNNLDVELTYKLYLAQMAVMTEVQHKLCLIMGLDLLVLEEMEWNGVKFDIKLCEEKATEVARKLAAIQEQLLAYSPTRNINLNSGQQLSCFLYGGKFESVEVESVEDRVYQSGPRKGEVYQKKFYQTTVYEFPPLFKPLPRTQYKLPIVVGDQKFPAYQAGEDILKRLRAGSKKQKEIISLLLERAELAKLLDTYYGKLPALLEKMEWDDVLHGQYNQCVASTGRLSSSLPNMQNFSGQTDELLISRYKD